MSEYPRWLPESARAAFHAEGTDAYRLADGPGWWIEKFGKALLVSSPGPRPTPREALQFIRAEGCAEPFVFFRRLVRAPGNDDAPVMLEGAGPATELPACESGVRFLLDFEARYSCGLFLDQRANRARLRALRPRRVLNLFAYTCSFSVFAALAGAETLSVDLSKAALQRGRANFAANGIPPAGHRFLADDVFDVLPRLARRGEIFDAIIVDPPTFSRGNRGRAFRAADGLAALAKLALGCAAPGAHVLLSTNASTIPIGRLAAIARSLGGAVIGSGPPPPDIAPARAAKTLWFRAP